MPKRNFKILLWINNKQVVLMSQWIPVESNSITICRSFEKDGWRSHGVNILSTKTHQYPDMHLKHPSPITGITEKKAFFVVEDGNVFSTKIMMLDCRVKLLSTYS
jgi:hypothetical protein